MGKDVLSRDRYNKVQDTATKGGKVSVTKIAEEKLQKGEGLDPMVDPKGLSHLGPVRMSLPRFERVGDLWQLTSGLPMAIETLLDTTGSMGGNVELAFDALLLDYIMLTSGRTPVLGRYDVQMATAIFNDVQDGPGTPVLARSQFEMAEKIAMQMANLPPGRLGCGNGKEDPQFGLFGAAYLTAASINKWGLKYYHFTISDEPVVERIDSGWLKRIFGDDVLSRVKENGFDFVEGLPDTARTVSDLQTRAHAFFLQVGDRRDVHQQWIDLYGADHLVVMPEGTAYLHYVKSLIIGLTEGVLDLSSAKNFLREHKMDEYMADRVIRAVAHIPLGAQMKAPNFDRIPKKGDLFKEKTDLWPVGSSEAEAPDLSTDGSKPTGTTWL